MISSMRISLTSREIHKPSLNPTARFESQPRARTKT